MEGMDMGHGYAFAHNGQAYTPQGMLPGHPDTDAHNRAVEALELAHIATLPDRLFLYVDERKGVVTTWLGTVVGDIVSYGVHQATWHGSYRQSVRVRIQGATYHGYLTSAGDYVRLRKARKAL